MTYTPETTLDMSWDEYTYEVDMMLIAEFGEPATHEQLCDITTAYNNGIAPDEVFSAMAEALYGNEYDDELGFSNCPYASDLSTRKVFIKRDDDAVANGHSTFVCKCSRT